MSATERVFYSLGLAEIPPGPTYPAATAQNAWPDLRQFHDGTEARMQHEYHEEIRAAAHGDRETEAWLRWDLRRPNGAITRPTPDLATIAGLGGSLREKDKALSEVVNRPGPVYPPDRQLCPMVKLRSRVHTDEEIPSGYR
jgi:hypothetical protein